MPPRIQKTPAPEEVPQTDGELIFNALMMWANLVETGNPHISATDAEQMRKPFKALSADGMALVTRLRALANGVDPTEYSALEKKLRELPMTWYPALLAAVVEGAYAKHAFKRGQIYIYVKGIETKCEANNAISPELQPTDPSSPTSQTITRLRRLSKTNPPVSG